tara:strand:- start:515 stop:1456 length:942 start_codon:yes stop_codon:yes gene_type:complete
MVYHEGSEFEIMKNITVVTCSMNRTEQLLKNIDECKNIKNLYQHIVIDFSSNEPIINSIKDGHDRLKIYRINDQKIWWLSRAYNASFNLVKTEFTLKLDADVMIDSDYLNDLDYDLYDHILFTNNQNDSGNFLIKTKILEELNGFNEYILRGYNDHDLISRILKRDPSLKRINVYNKIHKLEHKNELRVQASKPILLSNNADFYYGIVKGYNDYHGLISSKNLWLNQKRSYTNNKDFILINHLYTSKDLGFILNLMCKLIFLRTFFRIYFRNRKFILPKILKRLLPIILFFLPLNIIERFFGITIFPSLKMSN